VGAPELGPLERSGRDVQRVGPIVAPPGDRRHVLRREPDRGRELEHLGEEQDHPRDQLYGQHAVVSRGLWSHTVLQVRHHELLPQGPHGRGRRPLRAADARLRQRLSRGRQKRHGALSCRSPPRWQTGCINLMYWAGYNNRDVVPIAKRLRPIIDPIGDFPELLAKLDRGWQRLGRRPMITAGGAPAVR